MAFSPNQKYPGATDPNPNYKDGIFRDNSPATTNNGSPLKAIDRNERLSLDEAVMDAAGFDYNGQPDTPQNSQLFQAYKAALGNGANLLSNHNFLIASPDDSQTPPDATPRTYPPGFQIFSGVFANETTGILNLTYIDGRVSFSGGDFYMPVANTGGVERLTEFVASVADFDGKPRTRGVSFALVGDEYRITVGVDALEDVLANPTPLGSVKFEQGSVATGHLAFISQQEQLYSFSGVDIRSFGAGGGSTDYTTNIGAAIGTRKEVFFDLTKGYKVTSINLNGSMYLKDANINFDGVDGGFNVDSAIDGLRMTGVSLKGDGVLSSNQKGITSNEAITSGLFFDIKLEDLVQGLDLNSSTNTRVLASVVKHSVGENPGEGYGIIAGSSQLGTYGLNVFEQNQRHALYLNNALYSTVGSNVFYKHRDGLVTGGGLGALQIAGQAKGIAAVGNSFALCTGPELVASPQPANTSPMECIVASGNAHYMGQSANVRIGGATPSANEIIKGGIWSGNLYQPSNDYGGSVIQVYSGFGVNISNNMFYLKNGTGANPQAIALGLTNPNDAFFDNISICGNNGVFTKSGGGAVFIRIASELCLGSTRIDIFDNHVETDVLIDYAITPTNPNIRTDDTSYKRITLQGGSQDLNAAAYNNFVLVGAGGGSTIENIVNGYPGKVITILVEGSNVITMASTGNKSVAGSFSSTNKDIITLEYDGTLWREISRSLNT